MKRVDKPLTDPKPGARVVHGGSAGTSERRNTVQAWEREVLVALVRAPASVDTLPGLVRTMRDSGLLDVAESPDGWAVTISEKGRTALRKGWYPSDST